MTNIVLEGVFCDYKLSVHEDCVSFENQNNSPNTFGVFFKGKYLELEPVKAVKSWCFQQQKSPVQYVIKVNWDKNCYNKEDWKGRKLYDMVVNNNETSILVVDDEIFGIFNKYFFDRRTDLSEEEKQAILDEVRKQQTIEAMTRPAEKPAPVEYEPVPDNTPRCPTCGSTNIRKIDGLERGTSVLMLGLFSKKINKTFKCKNCGHTW